MVSELLAYLNGVTRSSSFNRLVFRCPVELCTDRMNMRKIDLPWMVGWVISDMIAGRWISLRRGCNCGIRVDKIRIEVDLKMVENLKSWYEEEEKESVRDWESWRWWGWRGLLLFASPVQEFLYLGTRGRKKSTSQTRTHRPRHQSVVQSEKSSCNQMIK